MRLRVFIKLNKQKVQQNEPGRTNQSRQGAEKIQKPGTEWKRSWNVMNDEQPDNLLPDTGNIFNALLSAPLHVPVSGVHTRKCKALKTGKAGLSKLKNSSYAQHYKSNRLVVT